MSETSNSPLAIEQLSVRYGQNRAVDSVSLTVAAGGVYALLGRNGAGKSSLVRCSLGLQKPTAGRARLFGHDAWRRRMPGLRRTAFVPERPDAPPKLTAPQIVRFCALADPRFDRAAATARLARLRIPSKSRFQELSRGQQAQVQLSLALAVEPELLVLDDPTLGLDAVARRGFYDELIDELADRGTTIFLTTHDLLAVEHLADRVGILHRGHLTVDEGLEQLKRRFRRVTIPGDQDSAELRRLVPLQVTAREWGTEAIVTAADADPELSAAASFADATPMSLEEIFRAVTEDAITDNADFGRGEAA